MDNQTREIIETVAECDVTYHSDNSGEMLCPYCVAFQTQHQWLVEGKEFAHTPECIVTKARELLKQLTKG